MARIIPDVLAWTGDAAVDFNDNYHAQLPYVADSNFTGISVLAAAVEAQRELYTSAKESILDIGNKTLSALEAADGRGSAAGSFALTVLAAAGTVAVTVLTAGTGTAAGRVVAEGPATRLRVVRMIRGTKAEGSGPETATVTWTAIVPLDRE